MTNNKSCILFIGINIRKQKLLSQSLCSASEHYQEVGNLLKHYCTVDSCKLERNLTFSEHNFTSV
jgi:hypothetical protein